MVLEMLSIVWVRDVADSNALVTDLARSCSLSPSMLATTMNVMIVLMLCVMRAMSDRSHLQIPASAGYNPLLSHRMNSAFVFGMSLVV